MPARPTTHSAPSSARLTQNEDSPSGTENAGSAARSSIRVPLGAVSTSPIEVPGSGSRHSRRSTPGGRSLSCWSSMHSPWPSITARRGSSAGQIERSRKPSRSAKKATVSSRSGPGSTTWARTVGSAERMPRGYGVMSNRTGDDRFPCHARSVRADRLVAILLLLQARGQVTAAEVAAELEVSERTARRDLEALGMAGRAHLLRPGAQRRLAAGRRRSDRSQRPDRARGPGPVPGRRPLLVGHPRGQGRAAQARPCPAGVVPQPGRGGVVRDRHRPGRLGPAGGHAAPRRRCSTPCSRP